MHQAIIDEVTGGGTLRTYQDNFQLTSPTAPRSRQVGARATLRHLPVAALLEYM